MKEHKFLYFDLSAIRITNISFGLLENGYKAEKAGFAAPDAEYTEEDLEKTLGEIGDHDIIISQDFSAVIAKAANIKQRIYISWIYDSPQRALYMREALYDTNMIFMFDKTEANHLKNQLGLDNIYYQPLAANITRLSALMITDEDIEKYKSKVLFAGNLYNDNKRQNLIKNLPENILEKYEESMNKIMGKWGRDINRRFENPDEINRTLAGFVNKKELEAYRFTDEDTAWYMVTARELSCRERIQMLSRISDACETTMYTKSEMPDILKDKESLKINSYIDAENEVFKAYYSAAVNLNITMASIESGIPMRIFDIMSVGGFVLSNYQEEIEELYDIGREIEVYHDFDEMCDKAKYYLAHENERVRIGISGYLRTKDKYTCPIAVKNMVTITEREKF